MSAPFLGAEILGYPLLHPLTRLGSKLHAYEDQEVPTKSKNRTNPSASPPIVVVFDVQSVQVVTAGPVLADPAARSCIRVS